MQSRLTRATTIAGLRVTGSRSSLAPLRSGTSTKIQL
jgi:hypothetical protein